MFPVNRSYHLDEIQSISKYLDNDKHHVSNTSKFLLPCFFSAGGGEFTVLRQHHFPDDSLRFETNANVQGRGIFVKCFSFENCTFFAVGRKHYEIKINVVREIVVFRCICCGRLHRTENA